MRKLTRDLLSKSQDSFLLALELYNKPTNAYRTESFCILFSNAWELLLKAWLYHDSDGHLLSIFRRKERGKRRESITFDEALLKVFSNEENDIKRNLQFISELRNEASHLVIQAFEPYYSRAFQAGVLNYLEMAEQWFSVKPSSILPPGFLALISDEHFPDMELLRRAYGKEDYESLLRWVEKFEELQGMGRRAVISVQYRVAIVKNPSKADIILNPGSTGHAVAVIEKLRDVDQTHPHLMKYVEQELNRRLKTVLNRKITNYDIQAFIFVKNFRRTNSEFFWKRKHGTAQYSNKFIDLMAEAIQQSPKVLSRWRSQYHQHLSKRRGV